MQNLEASFSILTMSIASNAAMLLGLSPGPEGKEVKVDKNMAKFNIDLLMVLQEKTKGNLSDDESKLITAVLSDLQAKYLSIK